MSRSQNAEISRGNRAEEAVAAVLPRSARVRRTPGDAGVDLVVNGQLLEVKWIGEGRLGDARRVLAGRRSRPDVVVARRMSPGAREALAEAGVGWVDETGAAEIATGALVVARTGIPPKPTERAKRWSPSVLAVAEAVLCGTKATAAAVEEATGLSMGSCVNALRMLTDAGLLDARAARGRASARFVLDSDSLLNAYATAVESLPESISVEVGVTWRDAVDGVQALGARWNRAKVLWAATGTVASAVIAPFLTAVTAAEVYVGTDSLVGLEAAATAVDLRPIEGGRLTLRPFPSVAVKRLAQDADGLRVAPWPRVYVDLLRSGVRGEEAAEHLRQVMTNGE
jgi:hypothetical protein